MAERLSFLNTKWFNRFRLRKKSYQQILCILVENFKLERIQDLKQNLFYE